MRKLMIMAALVALFVMATAAYAATFVGTPVHDDIDGTAQGDVIKGLGGTDDLNGRGGNDRLYGGGGEDFLRGSGGNDTLYGGPDNTKPNVTDHYRCGPGYDVVHLEKAEHAPHNLHESCEEVVNEK